MKTFLLVCFSAIASSFGARDEFQRNRLHFSTEKGYNGPVAAAVYDGNNLRVFYEYPIDGGFTFPTSMKWASAVSTDNGVTWKDQPDLIIERSTEALKPHTSIQRGGIIPISGISGVTQKFLAMSPTTVGAEISGSTYIVKGYYTDGVTPITKPGMTVSSLPSSVKAIDVFTYNSKNYIAVITANCEVEIFPLKLTSSKMTADSSAGKFDMDQTRLCTSIQVKPWGSKLLAVVSSGKVVAGMGSAKAMEVTFANNEFTGSGNLFSFSGGSGGTEFRLFNKNSDLYTIGWNGNFLTALNVPTVNWKNGFTTVRLVDPTITNKAIKQTPMLSSKPVSSGLIVKKTTSIKAQCTVSVDLSKLSSKDKIGGFKLDLNFDKVGAGTNSGFVLDFQTKNGKENVIVKLLSVDKTHWNYITDVTKTLPYSNKVNTEETAMSSAMTPTQSLSVVLDHSVIEIYSNSGVPVSIATSFFLTNGNPFTKLCIGQQGSALDLKETSKYYAYSKIWGTSENTGGSIGLSGMFLSVALALVAAF